MILLQSRIDGSTYKLIPLEGQLEVLNKLHEADSSLTLDTVSINAPIAKCASNPLGTIFIATAMSIDGAGAIHIVEGELHPMLWENTIFPLMHMDGDMMHESVDYLIHTFLENKLRSEDDIKNIADQFGAYGYVFDWESTVNSHLVEEADDILEAEEGDRNFRTAIGIKYPCPKVEDTGFYIDPDVWFLLIRNALRGENTLLIGPTGSGKTELIRHVAKALGKMVHTQDMGTVQDAQSALLGVHRINKEGHSAFDYAPFVGHVQSGQIILLDELNRSPLAANNILFPCLDSRRYLPIDIASDEDQRVIPVHEESMFFATANLGSEYSGTQAIDRALLDRFFPVELGYPDAYVEKSILCKRTGITDAEADVIVSVSQEIRSQFLTQDLSSSVSVRHTLQAAGLVADGFDTERALTSTILPLFEDSIGVSERSKVLSILSAF